MTPRKSPSLSPIYTGILQRLAERGLLYATKDRGPDDTVKEALEAEVGSDYVVTMLVRWTLAGQRSGHEWFACPDCGELRLMRVAARRSCTSNTPLFPPRCRGKMVRLAKRPVLTEKLKEVLG